MNKVLRRTKRLAAGISIFLLGGCEGTTVSRDINALQQVVKIAIPAKSIKWEIFGTPEDKGWGVGGRTDYITLVAQVEAADSAWIAGLKDNAGQEWIAPESARSWLSPYFQTLLKKSRAGESAMTPCKKYQVEVTTSGRLVDGFACEHDGLLLIHVKLLGPSTRDANPAEPPVFD